MLFCWSHWCVFIFALVRLLAFREMKKKTKQEETNYNRHKCIQWCHLIDYPHDKHLSHRFITSFNRRLKTIHRKTFLKIHYHFSELLQTETDFDYSRETIHPNWKCLNGNQSSEIRQPRDRDGESEIKIQRNEKENTHHLCH